MIDWKNQKAGWVQEKVKDLEYLESIDYANLNKLVDDAYASGSAKKIVEAHWEIKKYAPGILKDRSSQIPLPQADAQIEVLVAQYCGIKAKDEHNIRSNENSKRKRFHDNYNSKTPDIAELISISKDYSFYKQVLKETDAAIMQYYDFSLSISSIESAVKRVISDYKNVQNSAEISGINTQIKKYQDAIKETRKKAPKKFLRGIHKAYDYENKDLERLTKEISRFEKENFAGKKQHAKQRISVAQDLIALLKKADETDVYEILEACMNEQFKIDYASMQNTIYFSGLPKQFFDTVSELKRTIKDTAEDCQETLKSDIRFHSLIEILSNTQISELEHQKRILQRDFKDKIELIDTINPSNSIKDEYVQALGLLDERIQEIKTESSKKTQTKKDIDALNKQLNQVQGVLQKKEKSYQTNQSKAQKTIIELQKEKKELEQKLKEERSKKQALETDIKDIKKSVSDTQTRITNEVRSYVSSELKKIGEYIAQQEAKSKETNAAFSESLQAVSSNLTATYSHLKDSVEQKMNLSAAQLNNMFAQINKKLDKTDQPNEQISILQNLINKFFKNKSQQEQLEKSSPAISSLAKTKKIARPKKEIQKPRIAKKESPKKIKVNFQKALERKYSAGTPSKVQENNSDKSLPVINFNQAVVQKYGT